MKRVIFIFSIILCLESANAQKGISKEQQKKYLPRKEAKFILSKKPFLLTDTNIVSTGAVYVNTCVEEEWKDYKIVRRMKSFIFMRFFSDGRVFFSFAYLSFPGVEEVNDLTYGKFGRYIIKDGKIKIEIYQDRYDGMMYLFARHISGGVQFYKSTGRGIGQILKVSKTKDGGFYEKKYYPPPPAPGLNRQ